MGDERKRTVRKLTASAYTFPTGEAESDGTLRWYSTTMVLVEAEAAGHTGLGYTYAHKALVPLIAEYLESCVLGRDAFDIAGIWGDMLVSIRNLGRVGLAPMAVSAVDNALWDLKARLLGIPLVDLLGRSRSSVEVYGSGGFTSYTDEELERQLGGWVNQGMRKVKMKVGRHPLSDLHRVQLARGVIGPEVELRVDANEAYAGREALRMAGEFASLGVRWFEQPVNAESLEEMRFVRERLPPGMELATGEYFSDAAQLLGILRASAADVIQPDVTRCLGISGFLRAAAVCEAWGIPLSSHCAPALHLPLGCALRSFRDLEYFTDHSRIERMVFDGLPEPRNGWLEPDPGRPGFGLELRRREMERYCA